MSTANVTTFTHSAYMARCIGDDAGPKGCGRWFIPSVERIAVVVEESDSPVTDAEAVRDGFNYCEHCCIAGLYGVDPSEARRLDLDGPMEYPYDYFLNMVWPEVAKRIVDSPLVDGEGWSPEYRHFGGVMWSHPDTVWMLHATPFWEDAEGIVLQWDHPDGSQIVGTIADLPFDLTGDPGRDAGIYLHTMRRYLDEVSPGILLLSEAD